MRTDLMTEPAMIYLNGDDDVDSLFGGEGDDHLRDESGMDVLDGGMATTKSIGV